MLQDGTGAEITAVSTVVSTTSYQVNCTTGSTVTVPAPASSSEGLEWEPGDHFEYEWNTSSSWKNTCRTFVLTLDDNTIHTAKFKFT
jgi:hypothetical protein